MMSPSASTAGDEAAGFSQVISPSSVPPISSFESGCNFITIDMDKTDSDLFCTSLESFTLNYSEYAVISLELFNCIESLSAVIAEDGRSCTVTVTPPKFLYNPNAIAGQKLPPGHVLSAAITDWKASKKTHQTSQISYDIHLKLPFVPQRDTSETLFTGYSGTDMIFHKVKDDAKKNTNHACTALLVFEKEATAFTAENRAVEFTFDIDCDY